MNRRYWVGYAAVFSLIWIAFGVYSVIQGGMMSQRVLFFCIAFVFVLILSTWLSSWLLTHIRRYDAKRDAMLNRRGK